MKKKVIPVLIVIFLIILIGLGYFGKMILEKYSYSKEEADLYEYFGVSGGEEAAILLNQELIEEKVRLKDGRSYMSLENVHTFLNDRFYVDLNENLMRYVLPDEVISIDLESGHAEGYTYPVVFREGDTVYLALDYVREYADFDYTLFLNPNRVQITTEWPLLQAAEISKSTQVRLKGGIKSEILCQIEKGTQIIVLEQMETWSKVKTPDGFIGYVENKKLSELYDHTVDKQSDYVEPMYENNCRGYKINMAWHQVTAQAGNSTFPGVLENTSGINVISPTWFFISHNDGSFASIASQAYVDTAHSRGLEVWALMDNFTYDVNIAEVLAYSSQRDRLVAGLVEEIKAYQIDGLNVDFENVPQEAGQDYIQFIRELSVACRANNIVLSVDNYAPKNYNSHYGWKEQGVMADYVVIMGYDEHWGGNGTAGSVASIGYVEEGIATMINEGVPAEKIINAVPFYTRIWKTEGTTVTDQAVGIVDARAFLERRGVVPQWDEETCQNYGEFQTEDGILYQVWLEDAQSLAAKINIMKKYGIAGVAEWKLGLESGASEVWSTIAEFLAG